MTRRLVLATLLVASVARANVWEHAADHGAGDAKRSAYEDALRDGDAEVLQANALSAGNRQKVGEMVDRAITLYRKAAALRPEEAEPYARIASTLYAFYLACLDEDRRFSVRAPLCDAMPISAHRAQLAAAEATLAAWDELAKRAPLDPRFSDQGVGDDLLFRKAILHTQLATRPHLEMAAASYELELTRMDSANHDHHANVVSNLAETYMMLGRLDDAIDTYRVALRESAETSTALGLAVALDRSGDASEAIDLVRSLGTESVTKFAANVRDGLTFFVPRGEEQYYFALMAETWGNEAVAIMHWQAYIASGAHPEFQPRARHHLDALLAHYKPPPHQRFIPELFVE